MDPTQSEHSSYDHCPAPGACPETSQPYCNARSEFQQSDSATTYNDARPDKSLYDWPDFNPWSSLDLHSFDDGMPDLASAYIDLQSALELVRSDVIILAGTVTRAPNPQGALPPVFSGPSTSVGRNVWTRNHTVWKCCSVCDKSYLYEEHTYTYWKSSRGSDRDICPTCAHDH